MVAGIKSAPLWMGPIAVSEKAWKPKNISFPLDNGILDFKQSQPIFKIGNTGTAS